MSKQDGLSRADLAILGANVAALGVVANIGGMKVFEHNDVRVPVAIYAIGIILALLAILIAYASGPVEQPGSIATAGLWRRLRAWLRLRKRTASANSQPSTGRMDRPTSASPGARLLRSTQALAAGFAACIAGAMLFRGSPDISRLLLIVAAAMSVAVIFGLARLARIDRARMLPVAEGLSLCAFASLIVGTVLLLTPTISQGVEVGITQIKMPPRPESLEKMHADQRSHRSERRQVQQNLIVQDRSTREKVEEEDAPATPCPAVAPCPPAEIILVPSDTSCPACFEDKPYAPQDCRRCVERER